MQHPSWLPTCVYCGDSREALDHVLPWSQHKLYPKLVKFKFLVACCYRCNSTLGNKVFSSFEERQLHIHRNKKRKGHIQWTELSKTAPIVQNYLNQLASGKSIVQLDAEIAHISGRLPPSYDTTAHTPKERWSLDHLSQKDETSIRRLARIRREIGAQIPQARSRNRDHPGTATAPLGIAIAGQAP